jgi:hypothetical protein
VEQRVALLVLGLPVEVSHQPGNWANFHSSGLEVAG